MEQTRGKKTGEEAGGQSETSDVEDREEGMSLRDVQSRADRARCLTGCGWVRKDMAS